MIKKLLLTFSLVGAMMIVGCGDKSDVEVDTQSSGSDSASAGDANGTIDGEITSRGNVYGSGGDNSLYSVYFGFDRFIIEGSRNIEIVKNNAKLIIDSGANVRVEGNTDEWGSDEYNYALALKRASSVKDALVGNGVAEGKIDLVSYGESKPLCVEKTRACWQENRRADFVLSK
ncbi:OmpA family protein [Helicobacter sp. 23-1044]